MRARYGLSIAVLTALTFACGGQGRPAAPSGVPSSSTTSATAGATVNGDVRLGATAGVGTAADPMKVQVVGTDNVATIGLTGQFTLTGVPSGSVQLRFFGAGTDATVTITGVTVDQTITITVMISGTSAVVQDERRSGDDQPEEQIEGLIEALPPTLPAGVLQVAGRLVATTDQTAIQHGGTPLTFADLVVGERVHVKGHTADTTFTATWIEVQNENPGNGGDDGDDDDHEFEAEGALSALTGACPAVQFAVNGTTVYTDSQTDFRGAGCVALADGTKVEVKGTMQTDGRVLATRVSVDDDDETDAFNGSGTIAGVAGACPALTFTLTSSGTPATMTSIVTTSHTNFHKLSCGSLADGQTVSVKGALQTDGSVIASKIET